MERVATERATDGVYVEGLQLANAGWDCSRGLLTELLPGDADLQPLPLVWIRPHHSHEQPDHPAYVTLYTCPLFSCPHMALQQDSSLVSHVPLPTLHPPSLWAQKRVSLSCGSNGPRA